MSNEQEKKTYDFGGIKEFSLEQIESEILNDSSYVYLDVFAGSDIAFKDNLTKIENTLESVDQINAYRFSYKADACKSKNFPTGEQIGFVAQEIEKQFPELTQKDHDGLMYVNYQAMVPILLQSIKELSAKLKIVEDQLKVSSKQ